jgi:hypothetical protein
MIVKIGFVMFDRKKVPRGIFPVIVVGATSDSEYI